MSLGRLILACTLLTWCSADPTFTVTNSMLDPNRIFWWRTKWASAPILLSANNRAKSSTATFFISPTTSITNGVFEVTFPTGFTISGTTGLVVQVPSQTYIGGQDYAVTVSGLTNPATMGAYGPFALRTRYFALGQQVDVNLTFGSVYIYSDAGTLGGLTVTLSGSLINNVINKSGNTLSFKFTLGVSLWRYDTFVISTDSRWTIATGATCSSADYTGVWNNLNGTNSASPHSLDCVISPQGTTPVSQTAYIYGLAVDGIDLVTSTNNQYVDLRITSVTTPNAVYVGNAYSWTVSTTRFGTTTTLETATYALGPTVANDVITTATWTSTWGIIASTLATSSSHFMDLSFSITNPLPSGASIQIAVTEDVTTGDSANWASNTQNCYVITYHSRYVTCTVTAGTITLTVLPVLSSATNIKVRNIVKITTSTGTAKINTIQTYQSTVAAGILVDVGSSLASFTVNSNANIVTNFGLQFQSRADTASALLNNAGGNGLNTQAFQFSIFPNPLSDLTSSSVFTINCPLASTIDDFAIGVPSQSFYFKDAAGGAAVDMATSQTAITTNIPTLTAQSSSATQGTITFTGALGITTGEHLLVYQPGTTSSNFITLPRVVNNLATAYECSLNIVTSTKNTQYGSLRFVVAAQVWTTSFVTPCTYNIDGQPGIFGVSPTVVPVQTSNNLATYYVEVQVAGTANFNSGLTSTAVNTPNNEDVIFFSVPYPHDKSVTATTTAVNYVIGGNNYVAITGLPALVSSPTTTYTIYIPLGGFTITVGTTVSVAPTVRSFYRLAADPRYKFITHEASPSAITYTSTDPAAFTNFAAVTATASNINGSTQSNGLAINLTSGSEFNTVGAVGYYMYFLLSTGYNWSSSRSVKNLVTPNSSGTTYTGVWYFGSATTTFKFPSVLVSSVVGTANIVLGVSTATGTINISGFILPLGIGTPSFTAVLGPATNAAGACLALSTVTFTSNVGAITLTSITPTTVKSRGSDGVNISHTVNFSLAHGVPLGGSITLVFSNSWASTTCSTCTFSASSVTPAVTGVAISCKVSTNTISVTGFADFSATSSAVAATITVTNLLPPSTVTTTGNPVYFVSTLTSSTGSAIIDQLSTNTGSAITVTASTPVGKTTWTTNKTYPMTAATTGVDLYLKFTLPHNLPVCGIITLSSPISFKYSGSAMNSCFLSPVQYTDCSMNGGNLQITLGTAYTAGATLELYLDSAVDNPATSATTTTGFAITTSWGGQTVDTDTGGTVQTFTASSPLTSAITAANTAGLSFVPLNTGEVATYTFDFKDTVNYSAGDQFWLVFPPQFDYFLGDVWTWFTNEPNSYYIDCNSPQLGTVWCTVNHNIVVVRGSNPVVASSEIVININNVVNPGVGQTGFFQIYHVNSAGVYLTINQSYGTVNPGSFGTNLYVRSLVQTDNRLFATSDYTWRIYIIDTMYADSQLQVLFPREFDLNKFDSKSAYSCSSTWLDDSASASTTSQQSWNSASSCAANGNWVILPPPSTVITFKSTSIVTWTIQSVTNNQWGQPRFFLNLYTDFDVQDSTLWPIYPYWVSKFSFFVYRTLATQLVYTSRSYANTNAAYTGFRDGYRPLYVNSYIPQTKTNRIVVYAGTQTTDIYINTGNALQPVSAKQIILTPTTNLKTPDSGKLKYTSAVDNWILFQAYWQIRFRVAAAIDLIKGLYYINWANNETKQTGLSNVQYDPPVSTLVEVIALTPGQFTFNVATIPNIVIGYTSIPIQISISNAPHSDVTVGIQVTGTLANIAVTPQTLTFGPDVNALYFQIQVGASFDVALGLTQTLTLTLTGTSAAVYNISPTVKFTITQPSTTGTTGNIVSWGLGVPGKTYQTANPATDQVGVIYYQLSANGTSIPTFASLKAVVPTLINSNSTSSITNTTAIQGPNTQSDPAFGESWIAFQLRLYKTHLQSVWIGSVAMPATTSVTTLTFNWLFAATSYQLVGYLDILSNSTVPAVHTETFTTAAIADCQPFSVRFQGLVVQSYATQIAQEAANIQGVNPLRLGNVTYTTSTSRVLQASTPTQIAYTTFTYTLLPNRYSESPDPPAQAQITGAALVTFTQNLAADGIANSLSSVTNGAIPTRVIPQWVLAPISAGSTATTVSVSLRSSTAGMSCCVAANTGGAPTAEEVMLGLSSSNTIASSGCITSDLTVSSNSVLVTNLLSATTYNVYCTATDTYPLWPTQMVYGSSASMSVVSITTQSSNSTIVVTGARYLGGLFVLLAFLIY